MIFELMFFLFIFRDEPVAYKTDKIDLKLEILKVREDLSRCSWVEIDPLISGSNLSQDKSYWRAKIGPNLVNK